MIYQLLLVYFFASRQKAIYHHPSPKPKMINHTQLQYKTADENKCHITTYSTQKAPKNTNRNLKHIFKAEMLNKVGATTGRTGTFHGTRAKRGGRGGRTANRKKMQTMQWRGGYSGTLIATRRDGRREEKVVGFLASAASWSRFTGAAAGTDGQDCPGKALRAVRSSPARNNSSSFGGARHYWPSSSNSPRPPNHQPWWTPYGSSMNQHY